MSEESGEVPNREDGNGSDFVLQRSSVTSTNDTTSSRRARKKGKSISPQNETSSSLLNAFLESERINAERERRRDRRERKREKKDREREKKKDNMTFLMMSTAMAAFGGKKVKKKVAEFAKACVNNSSSSSGSDDESESNLSSLSTTDSPPTKRLKLRQLEKNKNHD
jgi:hypothetical protein